MSDEFDVPDGDIILRVQCSPNRDFRVQNLVLSFESPVFKVMFGIPQPPNALDVGNEVIGVTDLPHVIDLVQEVPAPTPSKGQRQTLITLFKPGTYGTVQQAQWGIGSGATNNQPPSWKTIQGVPSRRCTVQYGDGGNKKKY